MIPHQWITNNCNLRQSNVIKRRIDSNIKFWHAQICWYWVMKVNIFFSHSWNLSSLQSMWKGKCPEFSWKFLFHILKLAYCRSCITILVWSHGVMVSTSDSESDDPSSNLGGTLKYDFFLNFLISCKIALINYAKILISSIKIWLIFKNIHVSFRVWSPFSIHFSFFHNTNLAQWDS